MLGKDQEVYIDNITLSDGSNSRDTGEVLRYLLDTHFPGNTPYKNDNNISSHNQHASLENWNMAKSKLVVMSTLLEFDLMFRVLDSGTTGVWSENREKSISA